MKARIILAGGFLGAGKTTLLRRMAEKFLENGKTAGLITNDQASGLVDTAYLKKAGSVTEEVSGSCFCCNFHGLTAAIDKMMQDDQVDVIVAEPVGSCTDLSATILQPLKEKYKDNLEISPLNVLVDPARLRAILDGETSGLHKSAAYIVRKQLEEADCIVINKIDLLTEAEVEMLKGRTAKEWPQAKVYAISAQTGENMEEWLDYVMNATEAGTHLARVDYDVYAEGEAVLGWLNAAIMMESKDADWKEFGEKLLHVLSSRFDGMNAAVGHVKLMIEEDGSFIVGNLTGRKDTLKIRGKSDRRNKVSLTLNARVEMTPGKLEEIVLEELKNVCGDDIRYDVQALKCLQPGRPNPTYRYDTVVNF
ncbi:GTP-binding protein [Anaerobium acetethylicum]|uniref:GTPase, G3E family n=1 Tax=Anaerobium acetethylicum TaxID=1619234 RepID=A0A1D3TVF8_9FIRM|nr:GTP-binding protein [Anaerobium acetethylicum]SCP98124.1 GTPase, G3E family [Anaerobium acetethylicum]